MPNRVRVREQEFSNRPSVFGEDLVSFVRYGRSVLLRQPAATTGERYWLSSAWYFRIKKTFGDRLQITCPIRLWRFNFSFTGCRSCASNLRFVIEKKKKNSIAEKTRTGLGRAKIRFGWRPVARAHRGAVETIGSCARSANAFGFSQKIIYFPTIECQYS